jgi:hypothetical protein
VSQKAIASIPVETLAGRNPPPTSPMPAALFLPRLICGPILDWAWKQPKLEDRIRESFCALGRNNQLAGSLVG